MTTSAKPHFTSLTLAAYGWSPMDWGKAFYPDDLPKDWRISYYGNEFKTVLLTAQDWMQTAVQASHWQSDLPADFSFYVEITPDLLRANHWALVQTAVETLAAQVKGVLLPAECVAALPVSWRGQFRLHQVASGQLLATMPEGAEAQVGILRADSALSPQALRSTFEHLQQHTAHKDVVLFMDVPWASVGQVRLMQQLYGV
jgi:uncharacterized protein YecE (DUF72 family)